MSARTAGMVSPYPWYGRTRYDGDLPGPGALNPPDLRPWGMNPYYSVYPGAYGRQLQGLGSTPGGVTNMLSADPGIKNYPNELDILQVADDVNGNGVFDPFGSHGNIHPDYGVFADHQSLPGYIERTQFYTPSEVIDVTTGGNVMYVPSGAVGIDQAQKKAFEDLLLWELPRGENPYQPMTVDGGGQWIPDEPAWPIGGLGADDTGSAPPARAFLICAAAGLSIGLVAALMWKKK
jgi:hypothetical protein